MDMIVNKVAESGIVTLDLATYIPAHDTLATFDLKPFLYMEMILKEKDFRASLLSHDWSIYTGKKVAVQCSVDAIIPVWACMLVTTYLQPVAQQVFFGTEDELIKKIIIDGINTIDKEEYTDKRVVLKGCGDTPIPETAYVAATQYLLPVVKSLMYGEPCSTVPIYKKR